MLNPDMRDTFIAVLDSVSISEAHLAFESLKAPLDSIHNQVKNISGNTHYSPWVLINTALATFGILVSGLAALFSYRTATNVRRVNKETQKHLFIGLVRHLYRNKVCTLAIATRMEETDDLRPSDEHILKLKTLPEDIHVEIYNDQPEHYVIMHEVRLLLRNYNTEIDVFQENLKDPVLSTEEKKKGLNTILYKPFYLIFRILDAITRIDKHSNSQNILTLILSEHCNKLAEGNVKKSESLDDLARREGVIEQKIDRRSIGQFVDFYKDFSSENYIDEVFSVNNEYASVLFNEKDVNWRNELKQMLRKENNLNNLISLILVSDASIEYPKIRMLPYTKVFRTGNTGNSN